MKHTNPKKLICAASLVAILLSILVGFEATSPANAAPNDPNTWWSPPQLLLPYGGRDVQLSIDPLDNAVSYVADSPAYGVVTGKENDNWLNAAYRKLGTDTPNLDQYPQSTFDEFGTQYVVWGARNDKTAKFNVFFNKVTRGTNNVGIPINLTAQLWPGVAPDALPTTGLVHIAYSTQQHKVFVIFTEDETNGFNPPGPTTTTQTGNMPVYFVESADQGTTWSQPLKLGAMDGYAPAVPNIIVDKAGLPHVFWGVMAQSNSRSWLYESVRNASGTWSQPQDIAGSPRARIFRPKFTLADNGDIWASWASDPASGVSSNKELTVAHWSATSNQWQSWNNVAGEDGVNFTAIAVGSDGVIWVMFEVQAGDPAIWRTDFVYSTDNGQSWHSPLQVIRNSDWQWYRSFGMYAVASKGYIYLVTTGESQDPNHATGPALFLQMIPETSRLQVNATPTVTTTPPSPTIVNATAAPTSTATAPAMIVPTSNAAAPTATPTQPASNGTNNNGSNQGFQVAPTQPAQPQPTSVPAATQSPKPTQQPTATAVPPQIATATAYANAQATAAAQPQMIVLPSMPPLASGIGPRINLPTAITVPTTEPPTAPPTEQGVQYVNATPDVVITSTSPITNPATKPKKAPPTNSPVFVFVAVAALAKALLNIVAGKSLAAIKALSKTQIKRG